MEQIRKARETSQFINMRKFHNHIKFQVIQKAVLEFKRRHSTHTVTILDVSVGRFGDMHHYIRAGVDYVFGIDPDQKSIEEAENRLMKTELDADLCVATISDDEKPHQLIDKQFSIVCCHFTMHYLFENEQMLRNALKHISEVLVIGGYFIGTTIDGKNVDNCTKQDSHYQIAKLYNKNDNTFGLGYKFKLIDNPDAKIYFDVHNEQTEYLVHIPTLESIAQEYNLKLINQHTFSSYPYDKKKYFKPWETTISNMNVSFVFVKISKK